MSLFVSLVQMTVGLLLEVLQLMMLVRAVISWFPNLSDSAFGDFVFAVTEFLIGPVRALFDKFGWGRNMVIDIPFFVTYMLLLVIGAFL